MRVNTLRKPGRRLRIGTGIVILAALAVIVVSALDQDHAPSAGQHHPVSTAGGSVPPWPVPVDVAESVHDANLTMLPASGAAERFDVHLDIYVDGKPVPVAPKVGVDSKSAQTSPVSTHDSSGIIYVASPTKTDTFSLGQFFTEWQVTLDANQLGGLTTGGGNELVAYVNGKPVSGDPADITLADHQEIVLSYGKPGSAPTVAPEFDWPQGL